MDKPLDKFTAAQRVLIDERRRLIDRLSEGNHSPHELIDRFCDPLVQVQGALDAIDRARTDEKKAPPGKPTELHEAVFAGRRKSEKLTKSKKRPRR
jgi:hypothetical protein